MWHTSFSFLVVLLVALSIDHFAVGAVDSCCSDMPSVIKDLRTKDSNMLAQINKLQAKLDNMTQCCSGGGAGSGRCPQGFTYMARVKKCYNLVANSQPYLNAMSICSTLGADLAIVKSQEENDAIVDYLRAQSSSVTAGCGMGAWIAAIRQDGTCTSPFVWRRSDRTETALTYTNWYKTPGVEPSCVSGNAETCVHYWFNSITTYAPYGWNDNACSASMCPLCQI